MQSKYRLSALALATASAFSVQAQQGPVSAAPAEPAATTGQLESVLITATKRTQNLQATPIAVTVISGGSMAELNLNNLTTITAQIPTINYRANASNKDSALFIRGVGTISTSPGVEPTVSTVLDGVVTARPGQATMDLVDIERIEILRGPQGTLFGKNASAGVVNIISSAPTKKTTGYAELAFNEGNETRMKFAASGGSDTVKASIGAMAAKYDGNVVNVFNGSTVNGYDRKGVRGRVDFTPDAQLKVSVIGDYTDSTDTTPTGVAYSTVVRSYPTNAATQNPLYAAAVAPVIPSPTNRAINSDVDPKVNDINQGVSAQVDYTVDGLQFTSISAYRGWTNTQFQDQDRVSTVYRQFNQLVDRGDLDFRQYTQELRVASTQQQYFDYVAGLFYFDGKNDEQYRRDVTRCANSTAAALPNGLIPCAPGSTTSDNGVAKYGVQNTSAAIFGEGTLNYSQDLRAIMGLRYTRDALSYYHGRVATAAGVPGVSATRATVNGDTTETAWSGRIGPQYQVNRDVLVYATYSRGYKGPAYNVFFNMSPTQDNVLAPEKSISYEVGMKSELMNRTLRLNLAAFQTEYTGFQANVPDLLNGVVVTRLINAGEVSSKGIEMDLTARVTPNFTVNAGLANIIARVKNFACPPGAASSCDINGKPLPFSPDWKASIRLKYTQALSEELSMDYGFDASWQSETNFDLQQQPDSVQPAYGIFNARIALQSVRGWTFALIGRNLGDKSYATLIQNSGNNINRYVPRDDSRYFGASVRYDF